MRPALLLFIVLVMLLASGGGDVLGGEKPVSRQEIRGGKVVRVECRPAKPYTAYWLGRSFRDLSITSAATYCEKPEETLGARAAEFAIAYGDCPESSARASSGCLPRIEIQSAPLCERHSKLYRDAFTGQQLAHRNLRIRGVPAALYHDGSWTLEVYSGRTTISIFGSRRGTVLRAANSAVPAPRRVVPPLDVELSEAPRDAPERTSPRQLRQPSKRILGRSDPC